MIAIKLFARYLTLVLTTVACAGDALSDPDARQRVRANSLALQSAEQDYRQQRARGTLSPGEAADYRVYIGELKSQLDAQCSLLLPVDRTALTAEGLCPLRVPAVPSPAPIDLATERTRAEQTTDLVQDLDSALSAFDEMLLREQEQVKAAKPATTAATAAGGGRSGGSAGVDGSGQQDGTAEDEDGIETGASASATASAEASATTSADASADEGTDSWSTVGTGGSSVGGGGDVPHEGRRGPRGERPRVSARPTDIPDGSDDDVVARQLREAAEKETDPELKAKLWEEYRKYKRGTQ